MPSARRGQAHKLEIHHTPTHSSWLNMAEIELTVLSAKCLNQRIPDTPTLAGEDGAWEEQRNTRVTAIDWRLTTDDARIQLKRLYPSTPGERLRMPKRRGK